MNEKRIKRQYGLWDSPISSRSLGRGLKFPGCAVGSER